MRETDAWFQWLRLEEAAKKIEAQIPTLSHPIENL